MMEFSIDRGMRLPVQAKSENVVLYVLYYYAVSQYYHTALEKLRNTSSELLQ